MKELLTEWRKLTNAEHVSSPGIIKESVEQHGATADGLSQDMYSTWLDSNSGLTPEEWSTKQDGALVESVVAEYMDKMNMPKDMRTTDSPMDTIRSEALDSFLNK